MRTLQRLERSRAEFGEVAAVEKLACLRTLERTRLASAAAVQRLHEALCFLRAYPDDAAVLAQVTRMLEGFARRADLRRHAARLADTGIAGTAIRYPFFADTAAWLAERFPRELGLDWEVVDDELEQRLLDRLDPLVHYSETPALDAADFTLRQWLARLKGPHESEGAFLARRFVALDAEPFLREAYYDELGLPLVLAPGPGTPSRTLARAPFGTDEPVFQRGPLRHGRTDLGVALARRPRVRALSRAEGACMIQLAREAMVTRQRDLDVFVYGDPDDVRRVECGDGLAFAVIGFRPERRLLLEAVYAFLTLKNGVPIGYVLNSALFGSAEIAYNVFETFRGGEAAHVYGWVLTVVRHLFGVDSFTIYPYQLGHENEEGLASGAWWFYQRLGFRPRDPGALRLMRSELARQRRDPRHRSSRAVLRRLAAHNMYFSLGRTRQDVIGAVDLGAIGLATSTYLARRFGSERERGARVCAREAAHRFFVRSFAGWSAGERLAWSRWAPVLLLMRNVERWTTAERRSAVLAVRAKGGRRESDFVRRFDAHPKLRAELLRLASG
ncbi:MAG: hypothetical protein HOP15_05005 [Planctomycetes bacterium]|nr:hypothetical protein [Planctomycetota bacterium]